MQDTVNPLLMLLSVSVTELADVTELTVPETVPPTAVDAICFAERPLCDVTGCADRGDRADRSGGGADGAREDPPTAGGGFCFCGSRLTEATDEADSIDGSSGADGAQSDGPRTAIGVPHVGGSRPPQLTDRADPKLTQVMELTVPETLHPHCCCCLCWWKQIDGGD